jgi:hypothetical protein
MAGSCSCIPTYNPPEPCCPGPPSTCDCLNLGAITVFPDDSVGPCGATTGTVSFTDCFDYCACLNDVATLTVVDIYPEGLLVVNTINQSGLTFTPTELANANDEITITIKALCESEETDDLILGDYTTVTIFIKDLCKNTLCGSGEACNKCDGTCDPDVNLQVL